MKILVKVKKSYYLIFIGVSIFLLYNLNIKTGVYDVFNNKLDTALRIIFLHKGEMDVPFDNINPFKDINYMQFICFYIFIFLSYNYISNAMFSMQSSYRKMIIYRYKKLNRFIDNALIQGVSGTLFILLVVNLVIIASTLSFNPGYIFTFDEVWLLILHNINLFIFFIVITILNIILSLKYKQIISILVILFGSYIFITIDVGIKNIGFISYGGVEAKIIGLAIMLLISILMYCFILTRHKNWDII